MHNHRLHRVFVEAKQFPKRMRNIFRGNNETPAVHFIHKVNRFREGFFLKSE